MRMTVLAVSLMLLASCSSSQTSSANESARDALAKLRKLQAATQVGVNKLNYSPLLIDAKASVNQAQRLVKDEALSKEIGEAMDAYLDAGTLWDADEPVYTDQEPGKSLEAKYKFTEDMFLGRPRIQRDQGVRAIWFFADAHIRNAATKLGEQPS